MADDKKRTKGARVANPFLKNSVQGECCTPSAVSLASQCYAKHSAQVIRRDCVPACCCTLTD